MSVNTTPIPGAINNSMQQITGIVKHREELQHESDMQKERLRSAEAIESNKNLTNVIVAKMNNLSSEQRNALSVSANYAITKLKETGMMDRLVTELNEKLKVTEASNRSDLIKQILGGISSIMSKLDPTWTVKAAAFMGFAENYLMGDAKYTQAVLYDEGRKGDLNEGFKQRRKERAEKEERRRENALSKQEANRTQNYTNDTNWKPK